MESSREAAKSYIFFGISHGIQSLAISMGPIVFPPHRPVAAEVAEVKLSPRISGCEECGGWLSMKALNDPAQHPGYKKVGDIRRFDTPKLISPPCEFNSPYSQSPSHFLNFLEVLSQNLAALWCVCLFPAIVLRTKDELVPQLLVLHPSARSWLQQLPEANDCSKWVAGWL